MDQARRQAEREKDLVNVHDTEEKFLASMNMGSEEDNLDKYGHEPEVTNDHKDGTKQTAEAELLF